MNSIKSKLLTALSILFVTCILVGGVGYYASSVANNGLQTVFNDRVKPLRDLKAVADRYAVNIVDTAHKIRNGNIDWNTAITSVTTSSADIKRFWKAYDETYMDEVERKLADETSGLMKTADTAVTALLAILKGHDQAGLDQFVINQLYPAIDPVSEGVGKLVDLQIEVAQQQYETSAKSFVFAEWGMIGSAIIGVIAMIFALFTTFQGVISPLAAITGCMQRLAKGERGLSVPGAGRQDEMGSMAQAVQVFKDNAEEALALREKQQHADLRAGEQRKADMHNLADQFQKAVGGIVDTVSTASSQLESAAGALTKTAESTQQLAGMVAAASEETSVNVQGVAAASEQLSSTVTEISRQVQASSVIAGEAVLQAAKTNDRVSELSETASRIGNVIGLINTIAGQTNLLALNATIEAARAGDAGKGFAVVAQEVKALAAQTAKATSEIESQIANMQKATQDAVGAIQEISGTINKISEISGAIAAAVEQQGTTTSEIGRNVTEAAKGTAEVASSITDVSKGAGETGSASSQVLTSAKSLSGESRHLRQEVDKFLASVRAA